MKYRKNYEMAVLRPAKETRGPVCSRCKDDRRYRRQLKAAKKTGAIVGKDEEAVANAMENEGTGALSFQCPLKNSQFFEEQ